MRLDGKVVLVTGGSSGIGRAIALGCARAGADVAVTFRGNADGAEETARGIRAVGRRAEVLRVDISRDRKTTRIGVEPDRLFSLVHPDNTRHNFALELDRGTMAINGKNPAAQTDVGRKNFKRKILAYFHGWRQKRHTELWGFENFRVLSIVPSEARISNIIKRAQRPVTDGHAPGLFLYATPERIARHGVLGPAWATIQADNVSLVKPQRK